MPVSGNTATISNVHIVAAAIGPKHGALCQLCIAVGTEDLLKSMNCAVERDIVKKAGKQLTELGSLERIIINITIIISITPLGVNDGERDPAARLMLEEPVHRCRRRQNNTYSSGTIAVR